MHNQTTISAVIVRDTTITKPLQLAAALLFGIVILYGAGFVQTTEAHNAAHDMRHSQGFPCH